MQHEMPLGKHVATFESSCKAGSPLNFERAAALQAIAYSWSLPPGQRAQPLRQALHPACRAARAERCAIPTKPIGSWPPLPPLSLPPTNAAAPLGASRLTTFRRVTLPAIIPAIAAGAALSFARAVSEYGSLVLLSGNLPFKTEVTSVRILSSIENDNRPAAAAVASLLLLVSLVVIVLFDVLQRRLVRRG